ncbi:hypothetical protein FI667_g3640, partial [Globisporangium splendens]
MVNEGTSLRAFMDDKSAYKVTASGADLECGMTNKNGEHQQIPSATTIRSTGYTRDGPCETFKIDYSSCKTTCTLRWYWLGVCLIGNKYSWQMYKNCMPVGKESCSLHSDAIGAEYDVVSNSTEIMTASIAKLAVESPVPVASEDGGGDDNANAADKTSIKCEPKKPKKGKKKAATAMMTPTPASTSDDN